MRLPAPRAVPCVRMQAGSQEKCGCRREDWNGGRHAGNTVGHGMEGCGGERAWCCAGLVLLVEVFSTVALAQ